MMKCIVPGVVLLLGIAAIGCGDSDSDRECDDAGGCAPSRERLLSPIASTLTVFARSVRDGTPLPSLTPTPPRAFEPSVTSGPAPSSTVAPPAQQEAGISGIVLIGPTCPVVREGEDCDDKPYEADIDVYDASSGALVARVRSDAAGEFFIDVPAGKYRLEPRSPGTLPYASPIDVTVEDGQTTRVVVQYDSGIR